MVDKKDKKKEMQGAILYTLYTFGHMRTMASITPWGPFSEYHSYRRSLGRASAHAARPHISFLSASFPLALEHSSSWPRIR
jgi:hypothetical protein